MTSTFEDCRDELLQDPTLRTAYNRQTTIIHVAKLIRNCRESANITQKELAKIINTEQSAISRLESSDNDTLPRLETLIDIVHACNKQLVIGSCNLTAL